MCGRYLITSPVEALRQAFAFNELLNLAPSYNVAPTDEVPVVRLKRGPQAERELVLMRWGLVPYWAKDIKIGVRAINARAETIASKPMFRDAYAKRRCLVLADGYYEWARRDEGKQAMLIRMVERGPFAFAGLWERWRNKEDGSTLESCSIVTTAANEELKVIHDRAPVILAQADHAAWLDPSGDPSTLLQPAPCGWLDATPVSDHVNRVQNNDPRCIEPIAPSA